ncbi:MAG TPA: DMT family protein [Parasegetibacter sp.]
MSKGVTTVVLLIISNLFMTFAWYGHLKFKDLGWAKHFGLFTIILISWGLAFFEYVFQVPANKIGFEQEGGPFNLVQLKTIQEVITLLVFMVFSFVVFKQKIEWNHLVGFALIVAAVFVIFKKW